MIAFHLVLGTIGVIAWGRLLRMACKERIWPAAYIALFFCVVVASLVVLNIASELGRL